MKFLYVLRVCMRLLKTQWAPESPQAISSKHIVVLTQCTYYIYYICRSLSAQAVLNNGYWRVTVCATNTSLSI